MTKAQQLSKNTIKAEKPKRLKKCHYCHERKVPYGDMRTFCFDNYCIKAHNEKTKQREKRKAVAKFKEGDKSELMKKAQFHFNKYIRTRDRDEPCISCGNTTRQMHAGHFKTVGGNGNLRFNEDNCHKQCSICNNHLSGNIGEYEKNLRVKIGDKRVDALDVKVPKSYSVDELKEIIETYKQKTRALNE